MSKFTWGLAVFAALAGLSGRAGAGIVSDPADDFLPSYVGAHGGDLDVTSIDVTFDGNKFVLSATMSGAIGTTPGALYVWGVDRGAGTARFGSLASGVLFDSVIVLQPNGTGSVNRIVGGGSTALSPGDITISGNTITASVLASFLPSQGFAPADYTFNLWPRLGSGNNNQISDFAPDNSNIAAQSVPEPSTFVMIGIAGIVGAVAVIAGTTDVDRNQTERNPRKHDEPAKPSWLSCFGAPRESVSRLGRGARHRLSLRAWKINSTAENVPSIDRPDCCDGATAGPIPPRQTRQPPQSPKGTLPGAVKGVTVFLNIPIGKDIRRLGPPSPLGRDRSAGPLETRLDDGNPRPSRADREDEESSNMLTLWAPGSDGHRRFCDGLSRRSFLKVGGLAMGGLSLAHLLEAEANGATPAEITIPGRKGAAKGPGNRHKSVIMVYLAGGLSHQDTFDLKMDAPESIRGEFKPIASKIPGIDVCELLPRAAACMDRLAVVRSVVGQIDEHSSFQSVAGYPMGIARREERPHFGSVISKLQGPVDPVVPPFVDLFPVMQHRPYNSPGSGYLGEAHRAARMEGDDLALLRPPVGVSADRFAGRRDLLGQFDQFRRDADVAGPTVDGMSNFYQKAFTVLTSDKLARALDVSREDPRLRDRYGIGSATHLGDGAPMWNDQLLIARRLVEAGARCVTVAYGFWDTHGNNFSWLRNHLPLFDKGVSALVEDIHARGLDQDVTVVVWGEFGRSPKINKDAGRDHWARVNSALLAGGGMKVGQVIGSTDKLGGSAAARPLHYRDVLATVYHNMGIDPHAFVRDKADRPVSILPPETELIRELI